MQSEVAQRQTRGVEAHSLAVEGPKRATETVGYAGARESETVTNISATGYAGAGESETVTKTSAT